MIAHRLIGVLLIAGMAIAGCAAVRPHVDSTAIPSNKGPYQLPDLVRYNYRWSAEPHIDLFSGPATAIRAYVESYYAATDAHSTKAGYPGFEKAIEHLVFEPFRERDINDRTNHNPQPIVGTSYGHILEMTTTDTGIIAIICEGNYSLMFTREDGSYGNLGTRVPNALGVEIAPGPDGAIYDTRPTAGPARAPQSDMFGGWTVTRHRLSIEDFSYHLACEYKFPDPPEDRPTRLSDVLTVPYPTLPPYPGWPEQPE